MFDVQRRIHVRHEIKQRSFDPITLNFAEIFLAVIKNFLTLQKIMSAQAKHDSRAYFLIDRRKSERYSASPLFKTKRADLVLETQNRP
jgi:hypothetical protein